MKRRLRVQPLRDDFGKMNLPEGLVDRRMVMLVEHALGKHFLHMFRADGQRLANVLAQVFDAQVLRQRIDGNDILPRAGFGVLQNLDARVRYRPMIAKPFRLAAEGDALPIAKLPRDDIEPGSLDHASFRRPR